MSGWKNESINKVRDGTFIIKHLGEHPYQVCCKDIDPANLYDIAEVAAFWESLPDGDPRKQAEQPPEPEPELPDTRSAEEKRQEAYTFEADPLFQLAQYYKAEAEGFRLLDDLDSASVAEERARQYLKEYAAKKAEIRERFPDEAADG